MMTHSVSVAVVHVGPVHVAAHDFFMGVLMRMWFTRSAIVLMVVVKIVVGVTMGVGYCFMCVDVRVLLGEYHPQPKSHEHRGGKHNPSDPFFEN